VRWLETIMLAEAGAGFVLASLSCLYFWDYAGRTHSPSRRAGAAAMALVSGALALEALVFVAAGSPGRGAAAFALAATRTALLAAIASIALLTLRSLARRR
jgi:hypothetical protein